MAAVQSKHQTLLQFHVQETIEKNSERKTKARSFCTVGVHAFYTNTRMLDLETLLDTRRALKWDIRRGGGHYPKQLKQGGGMKQGQLTELGSRTRLRSMLGLVKINWEEFGES